MPRTRKTPSGANAQPIQAIKGQEYGRGVQQERMQRAMPTPAVPTSVPQQTRVQVQQPTNSPTQAQPQSNPAESMAKLAAALKGQGGLLKRTDDQPNNPFTQTLTDPSAAARIGMMPAANKLGEMMRDISRRTGDPTFANLATKAGY